MKLPTKEDTKAKRKELVKRIGKRITVLRERADMIQSELATAMGVSPSTIAMWETGEREIKASILVEIARFFKVSPNYLVDFEATNINVEGTEYSMEREEFEIFLALQKDRVFFNDLLDNPEKVEMLRHMWKSAKLVTKGLNDAN